MRSLASKVVFLMWLFLPLAAAPVEPFATQFPSYSPAYTSSTASVTVYRVECAPTASAGTAFLHKSGRILTAEHVIRDCPIEKIILKDSNGTTITVSATASDPELDIALLTPSSPISATALELDQDPTINLGIITASWGFPLAHSGKRPLVCIGNVAGTDAEEVKPEKFIVRLVLSTALNSGASGGPVVDAYTGRVVGIAKNKTIPWPEDMRICLAGLEKCDSGQKYEEALSNGTVVQRTEAQIVHRLLTHIKNESQINLGHAVCIRDVHRFLREQGVTP